MNAVELFHLFILSNVAVHDHWRMLVLTMCPGPSGTRIVVRKN